MEVKETNKKCCWRCHGIGIIEEPICGWCEDEVLHSSCDDTWNKTMKCPVCSNTNGEYMTIQEIFNSLREEDEVRITGTSGAGNHYVELRGMVATVSHNDDVAIKIWPDSGVEGGKVWFMLKNIEAIFKEEQDE